MKTLQQKYIVLLLVVTATLFNCSKDNGNASPDEDNSTSVHNIISFSPTSGQEGEEVTITGTNFNSIINENTVKFNDVSATISSVTSTQIITSVPVGATTGNIAVVIDDETVTSASAFTVDIETVPVPIIANVNPTAGKAGTIVTITGNNFSTTISDNIVEFNGVQATINSASTTELEVIVPNDANTGEIKIITNALTATSTSDFTIVVDRNLVFYGTLQRGGDNNGGTVFKIETSPAKFTLIKKLTSNEGTFPSNYFNKLSDGKYYSSTKNSGAIFSIDPSDDTFETVVRLPSDAVLLRNISNLIEYNGVNYFLGSDSSIPTSNRLAIYSFNATAKTITKFYTLDSDYASLTSAGITSVNNKLYATSYYGSTYTYGAFLSVDLSKTTNQGSLLANFSTTGRTPNGALIEKDGAIYGSILSRANSNDGAFYKYSIANNTLSTAYNLNGQTTSGIFLSNDKDKIYGTTFSGIVEHNISTNTNTVITSLTDTSNTFNGAPLVEGSDGNIYGFYSISNGTQYRQAVLFKYDVTLDTIETIYTFNANESEGWGPGALIEVK